MSWGKGGAVRKRDHFGESGVRVLRSAAVFVINVYIQLDREKTVALTVPLCLLTNLGS